MSHPDNAGTSQQTLGAFAEVVRPRAHDPTCTGGKRLRSRDARWRRSPLGNTAGSYSLLALAYARDEKGTGHHPARRSEPSGSCVVPGKRSGSRREDGWPEGLDGRRLLGCPLLPTVPAPGWHPKLPAAGLLHRRACGDHRPGTAHPGPIPALGPPSVAAGHLPQLALAHGAMRHGTDVRTTIGLRTRPHTSNRSSTSHGSESGSSPPCSSGNRAGSGVIPESCGP